MSVLTIQELIDQAIAIEDIDHIPSGKYNPSMFGRCYRAQYWKRRGEIQSNPPDARTLRVFKAGKLFHDFVQNLFCKDNRECPTCEGEGQWLNGSDEANCPKCHGTGIIGSKKEVKVESEDVLGFADIVRDNEVVDIKSQHSKAFWYMTKFKGDDIKREKYPNWLQVMYYARELKKDFGRLVFISKDDMCINEYVQPLDDWWLGELEIELNFLQGMWLAPFPPNALPRCYQKKDGSFGECVYCTFRTLCEEMEAKRASK